MKIEAVESKSTREPPRPGSRRWPRRFVIFFSLVAILLISTITGSFLLEQSARVLGIGDIFTLHQHSFLFFRVIAYLVIASVGPIVFLRRITDIEKRTFYTTRFMWTIALLFSFGELLFVQNILGEFL